MAKYYWNLNDFEEVKANYSNTKPIRGKGGNAGKVPIACRTRPQEEIVKVNDNCYALYDDTFWWWQSHREKWAEHGQAAILWSYNPKSKIESIRIRNTGVGMNAYGRVDFLCRFLPRMGAITVRSTGSGRYSVVTGGETYYLPKNIMHTRDRQLTSTGHSDYIPYDGISEYDGMDVTFTRPVGTYKWKLKGTPHNPPRTRVDKGTKAKFKEPIDLFLDWCWIRTPSIIDNLSSGRERYEREALFKDSALVRDAVCNEDDENRFALLVHFLERVKYNKAWDANDDWARDPKQYRTSFNSFINSACGFTFTTTEY